MKVCSNCEYSNPDSAAFCAACGTRFAGAAVPAPRPASAPVSAPVKRRGVGKWIAVGAVVVVVAVAVVAYQRINGLISNAVIEAVPADAGAYLEIDLMDVSEDNLQVLVDAYSRPLDRQAGVQVDNTDDIFAVFDGYLDDEFNMTVEDDVMPWIGRYVAFAGFVDEAPSTRDYYSLGGYTFAWLTPWGDAEADYLAVFQVRDTELADEFLDDIADAMGNWEDDYGYRPVSVDQTTIDDLDFYEADYADFYPDGYYEFSGQLLFGRSDDVIIIGYLEEHAARCARCPGREERLPFP